MLEIWSHTCSSEMDEMDTSPIKGLYEVLDVVAESNNHDVGYFLGEEGGGGESVVVGWVVSMDSADMAILLYKDNSESLNNYTFFVIKFTKSCMRI